MNQILNVLEESDEIAIVSHKDPDGDAIGSQLGLGLALEKAGKKVTYYNLGEIPDYLAFLPMSEKMEIYMGQDLSKITVVYVDCADGTRPGFPISEGITINIDHHISNDFFATYNLVDTKASATGEIIYDILQVLKIELDSNIATAIYTAISTDTGSFIYSNTTERTHRIAADLLRSGADIDGLRNNFFEGVSMDRFKMTQFAYQNIRFESNHQIAAVIMPKTIYTEMGIKEEDTEGIVSHLRNIKDVEVAIILKEKNNNGTIKGSLRSKQIVDVSKIASLFGGGGHARAAGFETNGKSEEVLLTLYKEIIKELQ